MQIVVSIIMYLCNVVLPIIEFLIYIVLYNIDIYILTFINNKLNV